MENILVHLAYPRSAGGVITRGVIPQTATIGTFRRFHAVARGGDNKGSQTLVPGLERRAVLGPQTLWPAQDSLLQLTWHALPWLASLALLSEVEAHVQQGWFENGRKTKRRG